MSGAPCRGLGRGYTGKKAKRGGRMERFECFDYRDLMNTLPFELGKIREKILEHSNAEGSANKSVSVAGAAWLKNNSAAIRALFEAPVEYENGAGLRAELEGFIREVCLDLAAANAGERFSAAEQGLFSAVSAIADNVSDPELQEFFLRGIQFEVNRKSKPTEKAEAANSFLPALTRYFEENYAGLDEAVGFDEPGLPQIITNISLSLELLLFRARFKHDSYMTLLNTLVINQDYGRTVAALALRKCVSSFKYVPHILLLPYMDGEAGDKFHLAEMSTIELCDKLELLREAGAPMETGYYYIERCSPSPFSDDSLMQGAYCLAMQEGRPAEHRLFAMRKTICASKNEEDWRNALFLNKLLSRPNARIFTDSLRNASAAIVSGVAAGNRKLLSPNDLLAFFEAEMLYTAEAIANNEGASESEIYDSIRRLQHVISRGEGFGLIVSGSNGEHEGVCLGSGRTWES